MIENDSECTKGLTYKHSLPLPPHLYEGEEYFSRFTPRIHRDSSLADEGCWQCQLDFLEASVAARADATRNQDHTSYAVGCINPRVGNFTALCACECLPSRLRLISYIVEYAYIHDDGKWSGSSSVEVPRMDTVESRC